VNIEKTKGKQTDQRIDANNRMAVVVNIAFVLPVPVVHLVVILVEVWRIVADTENHPEKIFGFIPEGIIHYFAVVKIFEDIGGGPVGVIVGIKEKHPDTGQNFHNKNPANHSG